MLNKVTVIIWYTPVCLRESVAVTKEPVSDTSVLCLTLPHDMMGTLLVNTWPGVNAFL